MASLDETSTIKLSLGPTATNPAPMSTAELDKLVGSDAVGDLSRAVTQEAGPQPNPYKVIHITFGATDWKAKFGEGYIAKNILLTLDQEVKVTANSEYGNVLGDMMEKFKSSTPGKAMAAIQKLSDAASGIGAALTKDTTGSVSPGTKEKANAISKMTLLPPNSRYQTTLSNLPAWKSTEPLHIQDMTFKFFMGMAGEWSGRTEVYNPVMALATVNLPTNIGSGRLVGPMPSYAFVYSQVGTIVASEVVATAAKTFSKDNGGGDADARFEQALDGLMGDVEKRLWGILDSGYRGIIQANIGKRLRLPPFYVKSTSYRFSTDTDDQGFPIWGEVSWSGIETLETANTGMSAYRMYKENE